MKNIKLKRIEGISGFLINLQALLFSGIKWGNLAGWASAWDTIYVRKDKLTDQKLLAHELCHIHQMNRHGKIKFMFMYLWEQIRKGYRNNKYEIEARNATYKEMSTIYKLI